MSEKEIIKHLKELLCWHRKYTPDNVCIFNNTDAEMLQSLLDLYNKEKEKNTSLQKEIEKLKQEMEERLIGREEITKYEMGYEIENNYISKDKIKNKIKELENLYKNKYFHIDYVKEILEELLEENNKCK